MSDSRPGQCLCGAIQLSVEQLPDQVGVCHCSMCRKWGGGPFMSMQVGRDVNISGEEFLRVYDSSPWAERGFCRQCGTHLFYRVKGDQSHYLLAGLMEAGDSATMEHQLFIDEKPAFYSFAQECPTYTGKEVFAMFSGEGSDQ